MIDLYNLYFFNKEKIFSYILGIFSSLLIALFTDIVHLKPTPPFLFVTFHEEIIYDPLESEILLKKAFREFQQNHFDNAEELYKKVLYYNPATVEAYTQLATIEDYKRLVFLSHYGKVFDCEQNYLNQINTYLELAISLKPSWYYPYYLKGKFFDDLQSNQKALDLSKESLNKMAEKDILYDRIRLRLSYKHKDIQGAINDYKRILELDPKDGLAIYKFTQLTANNRTYEENLKQFNNARELILTYQPLEYTNISSFINDFQASCIGLNEFYEKESCRELIEPDFY